MRTSTTFIAGRLITDPDLSASLHGVTASFLVRPVALSRNIKTPGRDCHIVAEGALAIECAKFLLTGSGVFVQGSLRRGRPRKTTERLTEIHAHEIFTYDGRPPVEDTSRT